MQEKLRPVVAVVDDDAAVRDSLRFLLEAAGFRVLTYASADSFLAAGSETPFACLLLDQHMPGVNGLELLQQLHDQGRVLPVALMTASPSPQLTQRAIALGAMTVLGKPLAEQALFRFVEDAAG